MENLAQRYAYATQIPPSVFTIKPHPLWGAASGYEVSGKISDLPASFSTVDLWDVRDGVWHEWINEERLQNAEATQDQIRGKKLIPKSCVCPCHCHICQSH